ncbi:3-hydroxyacyl-CoA dehydrogenase family protein [Rhizobium skierniewicense]|uniref:3-hydroxyacyl-CoA dehydrogenase family protein n=1 Tax=Rhizobium skierniewicense TaxID=984260 RepID=UPI0015723BB3|nr:3-hydroxyacyl-CoA dehydrogenase NAD-binding domain-containing protein [Rhizobium skierniewicense]NTF33069.1 3-hydroxyacyl-CoA dehydrogenase [Rhizobium skierniewicense]
MTVPEKIAVVGCGNIGAGWATHLLARGLSVTCADPAPDAEERLRMAVARDLRLLGLDAVGIAAAINRLTFVPTIEQAVTNCDWVQENSPEDLDVKRKVIAAIEAAAPSHAVIASSTSSIMPSLLQAKALHPERIIAGHPFIPVPLIALVEVVGGARTSEATILAAMRFYTAIGKVPIHVRRELSGHIANRLQAALMREAFFLLEQGVASAGDIDLALTEGPGQRWAATGPFISQHLAGGPGGAAAAFANLGGALRAMWADLGAPLLNADLQNKVETGIEGILSETPEPVWQERRIQLLRMLDRWKLDRQSEYPPSPL